jgi:DNA invertase Pin-like site-specific DNA recombinase
MKAQKQKRINLYSVKGAWRFDQSIQSKIIAMAFSMAAEIERDLISQRTKEAIALQEGAGDETRKTDRTGETQTRSLST